MKKLSVIGSITMLVLTIGVSFGIKQVKADSLRSSHQYLNLSRITKRMRSNFVSDDVAVRRG